MDFIKIYLIGLVFIFTLAACSMYFSFKRYRKAARDNYPRNKRLRISKRIKLKFFLNWLKDWLADFSGELIGAFIVTLIFGLIVTIIQTSQTDKTEKTRLIIQLGSQSTDITVVAAQELLIRGWLQDGTLRNKYFMGANLQGVYLKSVDLQGAYFDSGNLTGTFMSNANLKDISFYAANLCGAVLLDANLQGAAMNKADLREVNFGGAKLEGADFFLADLRNAKFVDATFDADTILPDGSHFDINRPEWEQLDVFTNPRNQNFKAYFDPHSIDEIPDNPNCVLYYPSGLLR